MILSVMIDATGSSFCRGDAIDFSAAYLNNLARLIIFGFPILRSLSFDATVAPQRSSTRSLTSFSLFLLAAKANGQPLLVAAATFPGFSRFGPKPSSRQVDVKVLIVLSKQFGVTVPGVKLF